MDDTRSADIPAAIADAGFMKPALAPRVLRRALYGALPGSRTEQPLIGMRIFSVRLVAAAERGLIVQS